MRPSIEDFARYEDELALQRAFAHRLRMLAMSRLANHEGVVAQAFCAQAPKAGIDHGRFLRDQSRDGVWGTYIEAEVLAEAYDVNLVVTPVVRGALREPIHLRSSTHPKAPTVHLYNSGNTHWHYHREGRKTLGDGNCLYNAFAQALHHHVKKTIVVAPPSAERPLSSVAAPKAKKEKMVGTAANFFVERNQAVIQHQRVIHQAICANKTSHSTDRSRAEEEVRIALLPEKEKQQIAKDHAFALSLAEEEMRAARRHPR